MLDGLKKIDIVGGVIILLLVASVAIVVATTPEVADTAEPPDSDWALERVNDTHMEIRHEGGDGVEADNLSIIVDEYPRPVEWNGNVSGGSVGEGAWTTIEVSEGQNVAVYWTGVDTVRREVLAEGQA